MNGSTEEKRELLLKLSNVRKNFGGVVAADDVNLEIYSGTTLGLIGPNGAGKTTLITLSTGVYSVSAGTIEFCGKDITAEPTYKRALEGIGRTFQHPHLMIRCDVRTNLITGADMISRKKIKDDETVSRELPELLKCAGLDQVDLDGPVSGLAYGQQKLVEVVRVLLSHPKLVLLDEPAAGLNNREAGYVADLIRYATSRNIGVLLIEHSMELVMSICDQITVLNFGHQITTGTPDEVQNNPQVIEAYLGREDSNA